VIVLAGGSGQRMGAVHKSTLPVAGHPMLARVLEAGTRSRIGWWSVRPSCRCRPASGRPTSARSGGGPVAGLAAGLTALGPADDLVPREVAVLGCDLPFLTA